MRLRGARFSVVAAFVAMNTLGSVRITRSFALRTTTRALPRATSMPHMVALARHTPRSASSWHVRRGMATETPLERDGGAVQSGGWKERAHEVFAGQDKRPVVLFDGVCNLCNRGVNFVLDWDTEDNLRFCALQSETGRALLRRCGKNADDISSIVLVDANGARFQSEAILGIANNLANPFPFLSMFAGVVPRLGRDFVYGQIAENRYGFFGKSNSCRLSDKRFEAKFISD